MGATVKALKEVTREDVLGAIAEYDQLGEEAFLKKYGYRPSLRFVLMYRSRKYPSKAIVGVAMGKGPKQFSGGKASVQNRLKKLGFKMDVAE